MRANFYCTVSLIPEKAGKNLQVGKVSETSQACRHLPVIPALGSMKQEDQEFKARLGTKPSQNT